MFTAIIGLTLLVGQFNAMILPERQWSSYSFPTIGELKATGYSLIEVRKVSVDFPARLATLIYCRKYQKGNETCILLQTNHRKGIQPMDSYLHKFGFAALRGQTLNELFHYRFAGENRSESYWEAKGFDFLLADDNIASSDLQEKVIFKKSHL